MTLDIDHDDEIQHVTSAGLEPVKLRRWRHVEIRMKGTLILIKIDGELKVTHVFDTLSVARGTVVLGLVNDDRTGKVAAEGQVAFANLEVHAL